jgi:hypothetical protein
MGDFIHNLASLCPPDMPFDFLRFTWFGDFACSYGEHYVPGAPLPFEQIMKLVNKEHSDDLVENLACWALRDQVPRAVSLEAWRELCGRFYELIKGHYLENPVRYSPDYPALFAARDEGEYFRVITHHTNCGGAMRSASLGYGGATLDEHLALVGMTHLYPESLAGAFAIYEAVRALKAGGGTAGMWAAAAQASAEWEVKAAGLIRGWGGEPQPSRMLQQVRDVQRSGNPAFGITDWYAEGITTRFVIPAAMQIAADALPLGPAGALRHVVEQGIAIGGDPDTLGSLAMALVGSHFGDALQVEINRAIEQHVAPENVDLPAFLMYHG